MTMFTIPKKEPGFFGKILNRTSSTFDSSLAIVDNGMHSGATFVQSLEPLAQDMLNESKISLLESTVKLALARKDAQKMLLEAGCTATEVAEMLNPTK